MRILNLGEAAVNSQDAGGCTALMLAADAGNEALVQTLLARKADPSAASSKDGSTPLLCAVQQGNPHVVRALLDAKADVGDQTLNGVGPVFLSAQENRADLIEMLLDYNADVNNKRIEGRALHAHELVVFKIDFCRSGNVLYCKTLSLRMEGSHTLSHRRLPLLIEITSDFLHTLFVVVKMNAHKHTVES